MSECEWTVSVSHAEIATNPNSTFAHHMNLRTSAGLFLRLPTVISHSRRGDEWEESAFALDVVAIDAFIPERMSSALKRVSMGLKFMDYAAPDTIPAARKGELLDGIACSNRCVIVHIQQIGHVVCL